MNRTSISWTDFSANPLRYRTADGRMVWACEKLSPGCKNCYASALSERYSDRRAGDWNAVTMATLTPFLDEKELRAMLTYKPASGKRCFVGDMTDVFGEWVPDELLDEMFHVMRVRADVAWQVLTKRADRLHRYLSDAGRPRAIDDAGVRLIDRNIGSSFVCLDQRGRVDSHEWPLLNVWLGVSCEDQQRADERIPHLLNTPAAVRFISAEPLIGPIDLYRYTLGDSLRRLSWVIDGGESGKDYRAMDLGWSRSIRDQCKAAGVAYFHKQGSGPRPGMDVELDGQIHHAFPNSAVLT